MTFEAGWNAAIEKAAKEAETAPIKGPRDVSAKNPLDVFDATATSSRAGIATAIRSLTLPSDLVAVPREPTTRMSVAGHVEAEKVLGETIHTPIIPAIYRAMLAAHKEG